MIPGRLRDVGPAQRGQEQRHYFAHWPLRVVSCKEPRGERNVGSRRGKEEEEEDDDDDGEEEDDDDGEEEEERKKHWRRNYLLVHIVVLTGT